MKELYVEGCASRNGPEHAVMIVRSLPKRWCPGVCGDGIEPRNMSIRMPTLCL